HTVMCQCDASRAARGVRSCCWLRPPRYGCLRDRTVHGSHRLWDNGAISWRPQWLRCTRKAKTLLWNGGRHTMKRHMNLNLIIHSRGHHEAPWRHPAASPLSLSDIRYYQALAQQAEAGWFDSIFLADQLALGDDIAHGPRTALEPITVLAALAV